MQGLPDVDTFGNTAPGSIVLELPTLCLKLIAARVVLDTGIQDNLAGRRGARDPVENSGEGALKRICDHPLLAPRSLMARNSLSAAESLICIATVLVGSLCYSVWQRRRGMSENRKIAAILAADVVGFSRLTSADEDRTLARLRALRSDLIDPTISVHKARVVKRTGDGALVEFRSVVDAVRCAIEVQNAMVERNAGLPSERRIEFRIGVHLGDIVEESDGDLMGDGVNIAARLEGVAEPGAICLSEEPIVR
jgi:class 3 adenylate cyclase